jgi:hypothetical protein
MSEGFLGRWSRRKQAARAGALLQDAPLQAAPTSPVDATAPARAAPAVSIASQSPAPAAPLTLADVNNLTQASDFRPFVAPHVLPEVRNAALKKLFTDPHYNVMDRLDTYIDDYSLPDPLPLHLLRQMASAKFLNVLDEAQPAGQAGVVNAARQADQAAPPHAPTKLMQEPGHNAVRQADQAALPRAVREDAHGPAAQALAESAPAFLPGASQAALSLSPQTAIDHDHTDLQLQPNHAAGSTGSGRGAG